MRLWLIRRMVGETSYDEHSGGIIRAATEADARLIAEAEFFPRGDGIWMTPEQTTCEPLSADGEPGIIMNSFHAG